MVKLNRRANNDLARAKRFVSHTVLHLILGAVAIIMLFPFLYMIFASFRSQSEMREFANVFYLFPKEFSFWGYKELFAFNPNKAYHDSI